MGIRDLPNPYRRILIPNPDARARDATVQPQPQLPHSTQPYAVFASQARRAWVLPLIARVLYALHVERKLISPHLGQRARAQGDSDAGRYDQATRSRQRVRIHSRRRRTGVVLSPELGSGQLRPAERRPARQLRRRAIGEGAARRKRPYRGLRPAAPSRRSRRLVEVRL